MTQFQGNTKGSLVQGSGGSRHLLTPRGWAGRGVPFTRCGGDRWLPVISTGTGSHWSWFWDMSHLKNPNISPEL